MGSKYWFMTVILFLILPFSVASRYQIIKMRLCIFFQLIFHTVLEKSFWLYLASSGFQSLWSLRNLPQFVMPFVQSRGQCFLKQWGVQSNGNDGRDGTTAKHLSCWKMGLHYLGIYLSEVSHSQCIERGYHCT